MDYSFKPTTNGRAALAACMSLGKPPDICRVAFGSGKIAEGENLADQHTLLAYVADGTIASRRHKEDRFYFTIQYSNNERQEVETFYLSEFIVYIKNPETGEPTDLLYGTLGDYSLPVPKYQASIAPSVFDLPLVLVVADDVTVQVSAPPGLVTYEELAGAVSQAVGELAESVKTTVLDIVIPTDGWAETTVDAGDPGGEPVDREEPGGLYVDVAAAGVTESVVPYLSIYPADLETARQCGMSQTARTMDGALRVYAKSAPTTSIRATLVLLANGAAGNNAALQKE